MQEWYSAREIAELRLPGMPGTKRQINRMASSENWMCRRSTGGSPLARKRVGRDGGGGTEYHVSLLETRMLPQQRIVVVPLSLEDSGVEQTVRRIAPGSTVAYLSAEDAGALARLAQRRSLPAGMILQHLLHQALQMAEALS